MTDWTYIPGGYILYPRVFLEMLAEAPLLDRALWVWLNCQASHRDRRYPHERLGRGQLVATLAHMREALAQRVGFCLKTPSKDQVRKALERLRRHGLIATQKTTRGLVITICDYGHYQDPAAYERLGGADTERRMKAANPRHDRQEGKNDKNEKGPPFSRMNPPKSFEEMDRDRAQCALAQARQEFLADD